MATVAPSGTATAAPTTHPFTCNTCQVAFRSSEGQRNHMHTDWHRYNLKRRVAELPPISSEVFAEKVLSSQADSRRQREKASFERLCPACGRTYYSENAFNNHINSAKHKFRAEALVRAGFKDGDGESMISSTFSMGEPVDDQSAQHVAVAPELRAASKADADEEFSAIVRELKISDKRSSGSEDERNTTPKNSKPSEEASKETAEESEKKESEDALPITACLFCSADSANLQQNLEHMSKQHGLFIPEQQYLVDLEGLIRYLGEKVAVGHVCLYCNKGKGGLEGVRTHMRDKGHCTVAFDSEDERLEIGEFYDFRSTYEDGELEDEDGDGGHAEGWETEPEDEDDDDDSTVASEDISYVPVDQNGPGNRIVRRKSHRQEDGWHSHAHSHMHTHAIYHTDYELHLPGGKSVGHRSLAKYYRQNLRDSPYTEPPQHRMLEDASGHGRKPMSTALTRAAGGAGLAHAPTALRSQALKLERRDRRNDDRISRKMTAASQFRQNNQKHFRDPILGKTG